MTRSTKLNERQIAVLRWIGEGCPHRNWPDESHKNTARALASRGLAEVGRKGSVWTATITRAGEYYLEHGHLEPRPKIDLEPGDGALETPIKLARGEVLASGFVVAHPGPDDDVECSVELTVA